jgi:hypothetical protein
VALSRLHVERAVNNLVVRPARHRDVACARVDGATTYSQADPPVVLSPNDADLTEKLKQENSRDHGYRNNRHRCENSIHQQVHRMVFNIYFHVSSP